MSSAANDACPVCRTAEIVCGKWTLLIIRDLAEGRSRFCELERSLQGISPRTLSLRLRALEEELAPDFVRIHRNALVAVRHLDRIERNADGQYFVRLRGCEAPLAVSRRMAGELRERFRL